MIPKKWRAATDSLFAGINFDPLGVGVRSYALLVQTNDPIAVAAARAAPASPALTHVADLPFFAAGSFDLRGMGGVAAVNPILNFDVYADHVDAAELIVSPSVLGLQGGLLNEGTLYLRTQRPVVSKTLPTASLPWQVRLEIARGLDAAIPEFLHLVPQLKGEELGNEARARGEYIAMTTCNECHGFSLRADVPWQDDGDPGAPDLIIMSAYDEQAFRVLMKTGVALGDRELEVMSGVARSRFAHFTDDEVSDLYAFLRDMSARAIASNYFP
jgi:mono/diheme cytochrome c family protein